MKKVGRNDPCPCGSGKKYKNCHENVKGIKKLSDRAIFLIALLIIFLIIAIYSIITSFQTPSGARPDGPAPAGKVWSEEHGHYHDN